MKKRKSTWTGLVHFLARFGQHYLPACLLQKLQAEGLGQLADLHRYRGLGEAELVPGAGKLPRRATKEKARQAGPFP